MKNSCVNVSRLRLWKSHRLLPTGWNLARRPKQIELEDLLIAKLSFWLSDQFPPTPSYDQTRCKPTIMTNLKFAEILQIAQVQLNHWEPKLSPECFTALHEKCQFEWERADRSRPYELFRGDDMLDFIQNWRGLV